MNATSLYVSTCRLVLQADVSDRSSWTDLYRLVPYLRQSLSCTVCGNLLKEPFTPTDTNCQHHVCKKCKGGRKKLKPSCSWCKDYEKYVENIQLRILLQCYKKLCEYLISTDIYKTLLEQDEISASVNGSAAASTSLMDLIQEGAGFTDDYKSTGGLSKSAYSILPCVYTNSTSTQTQVATATTSSSSVNNSSESKTNSKESPPIRTLSNGSSLYSVMYAGSGNKITIKRKAIEEGETVVPAEAAPRETSTNQSAFKKPAYRSRNVSSSKRKGCRCGNATATPGKLTCCGQRCPCYVDSKPCTECKCKGCRNPHRADGLKVRPHIPQLGNLQISLNANSDTSPSGSMESLEADTITMDNLEETLTFNADIKPSNIKVYTSQLQEVSPSLPATIMMDEDMSASSGEGDGDGDGEGDVDSPRDLDEADCTGAECPYGLQETSSDVEVDV